MSKKSEGKDFKEITFEKCIRSRVFLLRWSHLRMNKINRANVLVHMELIHKGVISRIIILSL
jgi:hypothetical protein